MIFHQVDLTEFLRVHGERDERLGRIDRGIRAVQSAAEKIQAAGVAIPETSSSPEADVRATAWETDGEKLGAGLLESLEQVQRLRKEVEAGEQLITTRRHEIEVAEEARRVDFRNNIKNGFRFLLLLLIIVMLRNCIKVLSR